MQREKIITALKKARSSIDRTIALIEKEGAGNKNTCFDVMQQNLAAVGLLKSANTLVLERHIDDVLAECGADKDSAQVARLRDELVKVVTAAQKK